MQWLLQILSKFFDVRKARDGDVIKPFLDHMEDLRWTLMKMAMVLIGGMIVAFTFRNQLFHIIQIPFNEAVPAGVKLITTDMMEAFMVSLKLAFYAGIVLSFPALLWFAIDFVLPALTRQERRLLFPAIAAGTIFFLIGIVIAYRIVLPPTIKWLYTYGIDMDLQLMPRAGPYFAFVSHLLLACGLLCELPVVVLSLSALRVVSYKLLSSTRPYAVTMILILVAILSPTPDPFTFGMLSLPVLAIYEACIWIVYVMEKRRPKDELV